MRRSSLYFAFRSDRHGAPVLIWPAPVATARSARKSSSVSPDRWEMTARYPALCAISTASSASESVPIWFTLIRTAFAVPSAMPQESLLTFVTNRSSPTSCTLFPSASVTQYDDVFHKLLFYTFAMLIMSANTPAAVTPAPAPYP